MVALAAAGLWWGAVPFQPALMLGSAAGSLRLTRACNRSTAHPAVSSHAGVIVERGVTFARPELNWLQAVTRLATNGLALAMLFPFLQAFPYVTVTAAVVDVATANALALRINTRIWWQVLMIGGGYWLFWTAFFAWVCAQHAKDLVRRWKEQAA